MANEETYNIGHLPTVPKGKRPTQCIIVEAKQTIGKVLSGISNTIPNMGDYGYAFIIYTPQVWIVLGNALQVVPPTDPPAFGGDDMVARYAYEALQTTFVAYKRHKDAAVRMIFHIFGTVVLLNLEDIQGFVVGHTPRELVVYLELTYVTTKERRDGITAMDSKMRQPFTLDNMIEGYPSSCK